MRHVLWFMPAELGVRIADSVLNWKFRRSLLKEKTNKIEANLLAQNLQHGLHKQHIPAVPLFCADRQSAQVEYP